MSESLLLVASISINFVCLDSCEDFDSRVTPNEVMSSRVISNEVMIIVISGTELHEVLWLAQQGRPRTIF